MKKIFLLTLFLLLGVSSFAQKQNYVIGFYNVENLFDIYDDPVKNDEEFLPDGRNNWTQAKYEKKLHNIARVKTECTIRCSASVKSRTGSCLRIS